MRRMIGEVAALCTPGPARAGLVIDSDQTATGATLGTSEEWNPMLPTPFDTKSIAATIAPQNISEDFISRIG